MRETYVYHVGRVDPRHNFSVYFYHMYLQSVPVFALVPEATTTRQHHHNENARAHGRRCMRCMRGWSIRLPLSAPFPVGICRLDDGRAHVCSGVPLRVLVCVLVCVCVCVCVCV